MAEEPEKKDKRKRKSLAPHWYFVSYHECVLCGSHKTYRERRFDPKPDDWQKRVDFTEYACGDHFA